MWILFIAMLTMGLSVSRLEYHQSTKLIAMIVGILYILEKTFWSYITLYFANSIRPHPVIKDYTQLTEAGFLKRLAD